MKKRCLIAFLLMAFCMLVFNLSVMAADERLGTVVDGSLLTEDSEVTVDTRSGLRGTYLSYGTGSLTKTGGRSVRVAGNTFCFCICDEVKIKLYLDKLVGSTWVNVDTVPLTIAYNASSVHASKSFTVAGGYYYRIRGTHIAIEGSKTETTISSTDGIWIS